MTVRSRWLNLSTKYSAYLYSSNVHMRYSRLPVPIQTTYTNARANLAKLLDEVSNNHETIIITRRGAEDVVLISAAELSSLAETVHLLRSPKNAERLLTALHRALAGSDEPQAVEALRQDVGLGEKA